MVLTAQTTPHLYVRKVRQKPLQVNSPLEWHTADAAETDVATSGRGPGFTAGKAEAGTLSTRLPQP